MAKRRVAKQILWIPLSSIVHADENPREAARTLLENGYDVFSRNGAKSLWSLATGSDADRLKYVKLMDEHEEGICRLGRTYLIPGVGQLQPIQVREISEDQFALICGLRRCLAWLYIRAKIGEDTGAVQGTIEDVTPQQAADRAVIENEHRKGHEKIEMAKVIAARLNRGHTVQEIANNLGISVSSVNNYNELAQSSLEVQSDVKQGRLNVGEARQIVRDVKNGVSEKQARKKIDKQRSDQFKPRGSRRVLKSYADVLELYCQQSNPVIRRVIAQILQLTYEEAEAIRKNKQSATNRATDQRLTTAAQA